MNLEAINRAVNSAAYAADIASNAVHVAGCDTAAQALHRFLGNAMPPALAINISADVQRWVRKPVTERSSAAGQNAVIAGVETVCLTLTGATRYEP